MRSIIVTASTGNWPDADSADSITASAPSKIAVAMSETSARVGTGLVDHRFQHLRCDDDRLAGAAAGPRHALLRARHPFDRQFDAKIAARHHDGVGDVENVVEMVERLRLFDLGHHRGAAAGDLLGFGDVFGALDERQRDPVDAGIERGFEIGAVLRHQSGKRERRVGQADALARRQLAADFDPRGRACRL